MKIHEYNLIRLSDEDLVNAIQEETINTLHQNPNETCRVLRPEHPLLKERSARIFAKTWTYPVIKLPALDLEDSDL